MKIISGQIINYDEVSHGTVEFSQKIKTISKNTEIESNNIIIPGFIDLHCHGGNGFDTMEGIESIKAMSEYHLNHGTTTLLPTTLTATLEDTMQALKGLNDFIEQNKYLTNIIGVHLEGPFINPNKLGAQPQKTQKPNLEFIKKIESVAKIKVVTIAPELDDANQVMDYLFERKINIQIGHSLVDCKSCEHLINKYHVGFTHLYNAMSGNDHREPGVVTAALNKAKFAEIICDLQHVSPFSIYLAQKCIPNLYAITDAIPACGQSDGDYKFAGTIINKHKGKALKKDTNILAGSVVNMYDTFKNLIDINCSLQKAVAMTSYNAAQYIGEKDKGLIKENYCSNFIILNENLEIKEIYLNGELIK